METVIDPHIILALAITCIVGFAYLFILYRSYKKRVSMFRNIKDTIYLVKNVVQYHEVYAKTVRWASTLGQTKEEEFMREELFKLLRNLKDDLGIKKNVKIR